MHNYQEHHLYYSYKMAVHIHMVPSVFVHFI